MYTLTITDHAGRELARATYPTAKQAKMVAANIRRARKAAGERVTVVVRKEPAGQGQAG